MKLPPSRLFNPFQPGVAFHIKTSHFICSAKQKNGFFMECNTRLKWVKSLSHAWKYTLRVWERIGYCTHLQFQIPSLSVPCNKMPMSNFFHVTLQYLRRLNRQPEISWGFQRLKMRLPWHFWVATKCSWKKIGFGFLYSISDITRSDW